MCLPIEWDRLEEPEVEVEAWIGLKKPKEDGSKGLCGWSEL
jgi:hypothetical protein